MLALVTVGSDESELRNAALEIVVKFLMNEERKFYANFGLLDYEAGPIGFNGPIEQCFFRLVSLISVGFFCSESCDHALAVMQRLGFQNTYNLYLGHDKASDRKRAAAEYFKNQFLVVWQDSDQGSISTPQKFRQPFRHYFDSEHY